MFKPLRFLSSGLFACVIFFVVPPISSKAQDWVQVSKLLASYSNGTSAASEAMRYGFSISISGNYAVIGAELDVNDASGANPLNWAGSAFILFNDSGVWKPVKKLAAPVRSEWGKFGGSVSISGDYAVVGEPGEALDGSAKGAAYIFKKDQGGPGNWGLVKRIQANVRDTGNNFGEAVDISGDYIAVGSRFDDLDGNDLNALSDAGSVSIYEKNLGGTDNWGFAKKITASVRRVSQAFGSSLAIDGDHIVVSTSWETYDALEANQLAYAGAAYIFRRDQGGAGNWGQVKKITPAIRNTEDNFGVDVDISGNNVIVGAPFEDQDAAELNTLTNAGAAYIFSKDLGGTDNWGQAKKLTALHRLTDIWFGSNVAMSGSVAAVGSNNETLDVSGGNYTYGAGAVYLYENDATAGGEWAKTTKMVLSNRVLNDNFGYGIALDGQYLFGMAAGLAKEPSDNTILDAGAVYVFKQDDAMPVTLASFQASKAENQAFLQWTTSAETNTSHFEIQKSLNAKDWATIGTREAAKESSVLMRYTYWDEKLTAGANYYRLKMVDQDGTFAYSSIRNLSSVTGEEFIAFPNPAVDKIYIRAGDSDKIASVEVRNAVGQLVYETAKIDGEGIAVEEFVPGIYSVQIRNTDGSAVTRKITIIR